MKNKIKCTRLVGISETIELVLHYRPIICVTMTNEAIRYNPTDETWSTNGKYLSPLFECNGRKNYAQVFYFSLHPKSQTPVGFTSIHWNTSNSLFNSLAQKYHSLERQIPNTLVISVRPAKPSWQFQGSLKTSRKCYNQINKWYASIYNKS